MHHHERHRPTAQHPASPDANSDQDPSTAAAPSTPPGAAPAAPRRPDPANGRTGIVRRRPDHRHHPRQQRGHLHAAPQPTPTAPRPLPQRQRPDVGQRTPAAGPRDDAVTAQLPGGVNTPRYSPTGYGTVGAANSNGPNVKTPAGNPGTSTTTSPPTSTSTSPRTGPSSPASTHPPVTPPTRRMTKRTTPRPSRRSTTRTQPHPSSPTPSNRAAPRHRDRARIVTPQPRVQSGQPADLGPRIQRGLHRQHGAGCLHELGLRRRRWWRLRVRILREQTDGPW